MASAGDRSDGVRRDTGYVSLGADTDRLLPPQSRRRALSPIRIRPELLSPEGQRLLAASPSAERRSPEDIQMEIDAVQREIDELTTRKPPKSRLWPGQHDDIARGFVDEYVVGSDEGIGLPVRDVAGRWWNGKADGVQSW